MSAPKINQVSFWSKLVVVLKVFTLVCLNLDEHFEHVLLRLNHACELPVVSCQITKQTVLRLKLQAEQAKIVNLNYFFKALHHALGVGLRLPQVCFDVVHVVKVSAAIHLHDLKEVLEFGKGWRPGDAQNISHF